MRQDDGIGSVGGLSIGALEAGSGGTICAAAGRAVAADTSSRPSAPAQNRARPGRAVKCDRRMGQSSRFRAAQPILRRPSDGPVTGCSAGRGSAERSEEHTSELPSLMRISYAVFCLKKYNTTNEAALYTRVRPKSKKTNNQ